ncbi:fatty-acid synthase domain protein [Mycobacterium xenopi 3993]|nr:fatty-acid synthase domain protein [Mycobacterium xenopi 3993]
MKSSPTVAGLAANTLKLPEYAHSTVEVLNAERDAAVLFATDTDPEPEDVAEDDSATVVAEGTPEPNVVPAVAPAPAELRQALRGRRHSVRRRRCHAGADRAVGQDAYRPNRGTRLHRIDHRRRVLATQSAASRPGPRAQHRRHRRRCRSGPGRAAVAGHQAGSHLQTVRSRALRRDQRPAADGSRPSGKRPAAIAERVKKTWELGDGWPSTSPSKSRWVPGRAQACAAARSGTCTRAR